ncbi:hypothetical protein HI914_05732 [Erysiphe necator]|nr:hypothetical protein HI914_05732 [Erysiphe necator]
MERVRSLNDIPLPTFNPPNSKSLWRVALNKITAVSLYIAIASNLARIYTGLTNLISRNLLLFWTHQLSVYVARASQVCSSLIPHGITKRNVSTKQIKRITLKSRHFYFPEILNCMLSLGEPHPPNTTDQVEDSLPEPFQDKVKCRARLHNGKKRLQCSARPFSI